MALWSHNEKSASKGCYGIFWVHSTVSALIWWTSVAKSAKVCHLLSEMYDFGKFWRTIDEGLSKVQLHIPIIEERLVCTEREQVKHTHLFELWQIFIFVKFPVLYSWAVIVKECNGSWQRSLCLTVADLFSGLPGNWKMPNRVLRQ